MFRAGIGIRANFFLCTGVLLAALVGSNVDTFLERVRAA